MHTPPPPPHTHTFLARKKTVGGTVGSRGEGYNLVRLMFFFLFLFARAAGHAPLDWPISPLDQWAGGWADQRLTRGRANPI